MQNFQAIHAAKQQNYDVIILPETAFPLSLNLHPKLLDALKNLSQDITIITGSIHQEGQQYFNSAYIFENGEVQIFNKRILVPFGEEIPLPRFLTKWINATFFNGAEDFSKEYGVVHIYLATPFITYPLNHLTQRTTAIVPPYLKLGNI